MNLDLDKAVTVNFFFTAFFIFFIFYFFFLLTHKYLITLIKVSLSNVPFKLLFLIHP